LDQTLLQRLLILLTFLLSAQQWIVAPRDREDDYRARGASALFGSPARDG